MAAETGRGEEEFVYAPVRTHFTMTPGAEHVHIFLGHNFGRRHGLGIGPPTGIAYLQAGMMESDMESALRLRMSQETNIRSPLAFV